MNIDFLQLGMNLLIAVISGWVGGKIGVRRALEQVKGERAFDRRLEWYESMVKALKRLKTINDGRIICMQRKDRERAETLLGQLDEAGSELVARSEAGILYAKSDTLKRLKASLIQLAAFNTELLKARAEGESLEQIAVRFNSLGRLLNEIALMLAQEVRKDLALDNISMEHL